MGRFSSVQWLSHVWFFVAPWTTARQASLSITNSRSLFRLISIELMPSNHLILCHPLLLPASGSFQMRQPFISGGQSIRASASVLPMDIQDWFPLGWTGYISFAVQGTLKNLLQHHIAKASVLRCSAFFIVQLSHPYFLICYLGWS